jgi:hypothetical protein
MKSRRYFGTFAVCFLASCLRSTDEIPQVGEGVFVNGIVVERDATSGEVRGLEGARVSAVGVSISATTDQRGFFQLQRLPLGRLKIRIEKRAQAGRPALGRSLDPLNALVQGQTIDLGEIELLPTGGLSGFVGIKVDGVLQPSAASGALVVGAQTTFKAIAGEDGEYLLSGLPEGSVDLVAFYPQHDPSRVAGVDVTAGIRKIVEDMVLVPSTGAAEFQVSGLAKLQGQDESSGISVKFIDESLPANPPAETTTNASGSYSVTIPFGVYRARFSKEGYVPVEIPGVAVLKEGVVGLASVLLGAVGAGDSDGDGIPDGQDPDRDNDGCINGDDQFPDDPFACTDTDGDTIADELDGDDDGDGLDDPEEQSPGDDGFITNPLSTDTDGDGVLEGRDLMPDNCPTVANPGQENVLVPSTPRGDACEEDVVFVMPPVIDRVEPNEGKAGDMVAIIGMNFMAGVPNAVRFGDGGAYSYELSVSPTRILVTVPEGAQTGTVTVYLPNGTASKANAFTFLAPPEISDFEPRIARRASVVAVVGKYFIPDQLKAFVNGIQAEIVTDAMGNVVIEDYFRDREPKQLIRIRVPNTMSGVIRISTVNGFGDSPVSLTISGGPTIISVAPQRVLNGDPILINGSGFSTEDTGGEVLVKFNNVTDPVPPTFSSNTSIRVNVPPGATTGYVEVVHPAGTATSPEMLEIGGPVSYVNTIEPPLAREGETIELRGAGLTGATEVRFGAVNAPVLTGQSTDTRVAVVVPTNPGVGPLEVLFAAAPSIITNVSFRLLTIYPRGPSAGVGVGYSANGTNIYVVRPGEAKTYDLDFMEVETHPIMIAETPNGFQVSPDGTWGVMSVDGADKTYLVSLPYFTLDFTCPHSPRLSPDVVGGTPAQEFRFNADSTQAYLSDPRAVSNTEDGVLVIDKDPPNCEIIAPEQQVPPASDYRGILSLSRSDLLIADAQLGLTIYSVDRMFGFGTLVSPFQGPGIAQTRLFWGPGNAYVLGMGPGLWRIDPTTSSAPTVLETNFPLDGALSSDHRWLASGGRIYDVERARFARPQTDYFSSRGVAWHPVRNEFIAAEATFSGLLRLQITEN